MSNDPSTIDSHSVPTILTLPNETLHNILSFISKFSTRRFNRNGVFVKYSSNGKQYNTSQILILRSVCRRFRAITLDLDFWYDRYFQFTHLIPGSYRERWRARKASLSKLLEREMQFLKVLFGDTTLVDALGRRKKEWKFDNFRELEAVMQGIPLFMQNARTIYLAMLPGIVDRSLDKAIEKVAACSHITTLIMRMGGSLDLNKIAASFPLLETLYCHCIKDFRGSLQQLAFLQSLSLRVDDIPNLHQPWLPLQSAKTLTELMLKCGPEADISFFDISSLDELTNLKFLEIGPLSPPICNYLLRSKTSLDIFATELFPRLAPIEKIREVFQATCLNNLREFALSTPLEDCSSRSETCFHTAPETKQDLFLAFDAFTSMLSSVEKVQLSVPLAHIDCCPFFSRMTNLKLLTWYGAAYPTLGDDWESEQEKVEMSLGKAFEKFVEKPRFTVDFWR